MCRRSRGSFRPSACCSPTLRVDKVWTQAFRSTDVDAAEVQRNFQRIAARAVEELRQEGFAGEPAIRATGDQHALLSAKTTSTRSRLEGSEVTDESLRAAFERFAEMHRQRYGYAIEGETIELVSFKVTAIGPAPRGRALKEPATSRADEASRREVFFRGTGWMEAAVIHRSGLERERDALGAGDPTRGGIDHPRPAGYERAQIAARKL